MEDDKLYCPKCCGENIVYMYEKKETDGFGKPILNVLYQCDDCHHEWIEIVEVEDNAN